MPDSVTVPVTVPPVQPLMWTVPVSMFPLIPPLKAPSMPQAVARNVPVTLVPCCVSCAEAGESAQSDGVSDWNVPAHSPFTLTVVLLIGGDVTLFESLHPNAAIARAATATPIRNDRRSGSRMTDTPF